MIIQRKINGRRDWEMDETYCPEKENQDAAGHEKFLLFSLGESHYGISITVVTEIITIPAIIRISDYPDYVKGICNLRGKIIPIIDLNKRLFLQDTVYTDRTCVIVADIEDMAVGLLVDSVSEVMRLTEDVISDVPELSRTEGSRFTGGIGKVGNKIILLLDCVKILSGEDIWTNCPDETDR
jgi:purine-binding chemotaxis protein CheW